MNLPNQVSKSVRRRNPGLFPETPVISITPSPDAAFTPRTGLSKTELALNKTEQAYYAWAKACGWQYVGVQNITLLLAHDCRFTPDFTLWSPESGVTLVDTKATNKKTGKPLVREDAMIKMRAAARLFPFIRFVVAYRHGEVWHHQEIKP